MGKVYRQVHANSIFQILYRHFFRICGHHRPDPSPRYHLPSGSNWLHGAYTPDKPLKSNVTRPSLWGTMAPLVRRGLWRKLCYVRGSQDSNWRTTIRAPWDDDVRLIQLFNLATWLTKMMPRNILRIQLFKMIRNPFEIAFTTKSWCFMAQICHFFEKYIF